ncbi:uncharacterized protein BXZ73DRAFT_76861 [Epithele typhae]|uniref:uncharacterized protein n=1 Tax=Epithele typhae TaxID=378194 RepID=UPI0020085056|nr:uncharacterized protein BXZ73DRAFT_76861 [Epithele typhae]KAH9935160.1 hypothetical protein BXZ73DRAFT_76861 [Epithele typhae]
MASNNTTGALSASQASRLRHELTMLADQRVFPVLVETALFGEHFCRILGKVHVGLTLLVAVFTLLSGFSTWILCKRGIRASWSNRIMLFFTLAMYAISTLDWAIDIKLLQNDLHSLTLVGLGVRTPPFGLSSPALLTLQGITSVVCIILGDAVVCWRVCVVWANQRWVTAMVAFWVLGSIGVFTAWSVISSDGTPSLADDPSVLSRRHIPFGTFTAPFLPSTNDHWSRAGARHRRQRRDFRRHMRSSGLAVHNILTLLVDFGVIYTIFMLLNVIVLAPQLNGGVFFSYVVLFMQQITGMYPTAVIALVALRKSALEHHFTYPPTSPRSGAPRARTRSSPSTSPRPPAPHGRHDDARRRRRRRRPLPVVRVRVRVRRQAPARAGVPPRGHGRHERDECGEREGRVRVWAGEEGELESPVEGVAEPDREAERDAGHGDGWGRRGSRTYAYATLQNIPG